MSTLGILIYHTIVLYYHILLYCTLYHIPLHLIPLFRLRGLLGNKPAHSTTMADKSVAIERGKHKRKCKEYNSESDYDTDDELVSSAEFIQ